jgi:predicted transcriptional regulator
MREVSNTISAEKQKKIKQKLIDGKNKIELIAFFRFLQKEIEERNIKPARILKDSNLNKNTYYAILRGERKPSRNKVIQLAFGMNYSVKETNDLLWRAGYVYLNKTENFRDTIIDTCLENNLDIHDTEDMLQELGEELFVND